jgi:hypothetical protein
MWQLRRLYLQLFIHIELVKTIIYIYQLKLVLCQQQGLRDITCPCLASSLALLSLVVLSWKHFLSL